MHVTGELGQYGAWFGHEGLDAGRGGEGGADLEPRWLHRAAPQPVPCCLLMLWRVLPSTHLLPVLQGEGGDQPWSGWTCEVQAAAHAKNQLLCGFLIKGTKVQKLAEEAREAREQRRSRIDTCSRPALPDATGPWWLDLRRDMTFSFRLCAVCSVWRKETFVDCFVNEHSSRIFFYYFS